MKKSCWDLSDDIMQIFVFSRGQKVVISGLKWKSGASNIYTGAVNKWSEQYHMGFTEMIDNMCRKYLVTESFTQMPQFWSEPLCYEGKSPKMEYFAYIS
jgi:hypothetical protein